METKHTQTLDRYIRARYPVISVITHEESRVAKNISGMVGERNDLTNWIPRQVAVWSVTTGLVGVENVDPEETTDPAAALFALTEVDPGARPTVFIFKDLHHYTDNPIIVRSLRDVADHFSQSAHTLILVSPEFKVPGDLEKTIVVMDWALPDRKELAQVLKSVEKSLPANIPNNLNGSREAVISALMGLTSFEAYSAILNAVVATKELNESVIPFVIAEKAQITRKSGLLEFVETKVTGSDVGGLDALKAYSARKRLTFTEKAKEYGLTPAKGVMLVGIPGTGKSLSAKAIAGGQMPLLRMDIGALMGSLVGESESNMRAALKVAEAVAPAVVWLDEIEKALGSGGSELDGGTSTRVFGPLLTWMQETTAPIYIVATANDVRSLRPELLRRFDDIFFVDLPDQEARKQVFSIHLGKHGRKPEKFDLDGIAAKTWGYTGAEIEKIVNAALEMAFFEGKEVTDNHLAAATKEIIPISVTMQDEIEALRKWAAGRARKAAEPLEDKPKEAVEYRAPVF